MVLKDENICPECKGKLIYYDNVKRLVRTQGKNSRWVKIRRLKCKICGRLHREIPDYLFPYKQYEAEIIRGVMEEIITSTTYGYEDYPCEMTMSRWKTSQKLHSVL